MEIDSIQFEQGEEGAIPSVITVSMTLAEAVAITKVFGSFNDAERKKRGIPETEIYSALCGDVFNRYWEDGVDGAAREV
jgi:hypothetical protein